MIKLTGFNNTEFYLNCELIEKIEVTPDTVITTVNGKKFVVKESPEDIIKKIIEFKRKFMLGLPEVEK